MTQYVKLLELVKAATGPDREIDFLIEAEIENRDVRFVERERFGRQMLAKHRHAPFDECWMDAPGAVSKGYTSSIDAIEALIARKVPGLVIKATRLGDGSRFWQIIEAWMDGLEVVDDSTPLNPRPGALAFTEVFLLATIAAALVKS